MGEDLINIKMESPRFYHVEPPRLRKLLEISMACMKPWPISRGTSDAKSPHNCEVSANSQKNAISWQAFLPTGIESSGDKMHSIHHVGSSAVQSPTQGKPLGDSEKITSGIVYNVHGDSAGPQQAASLQTRARSHGASKRRLRLHLRDMICHRGRPSNYPPRLHQYRQRGLERQTRIPQGIPKFQATEYQTTNKKLLMQVQACQSRTAEEYQIPVAQSAQHGNAQNR